jgi:hypothetical protein
MLVGRTLSDVQGENGLILIFGDRRRGGCEADGMMSVTDERPYQRPPQMNADRDAGRDCVLSAELVTAKLITVTLLKVSRRE